jgi:hypothetical protein
MSILESKIEDDVTKFCKANKIRCEKLKMASQSGWPDRTLFYKDHCMFLELKKFGEKPTPLQYYMIEQLNFEGFKAHWANTSQDAIELIEDWKKYVDLR